MVLLIGDILVGGMWMIRFDHLTKNLEADLHGRLRYDIFFFVLMYYILLITTSCLFDSQKSDLEKKLLYICKPNCDSDFIVRY